MAFRVLSGWLNWYKSIHILYHNTTMEKYIVFFVQIKYGSLILFSKQVLINDVFEHKKTQWIRVNDLIGNT